MFRTVLVANRGEIARRIARTCRSLGVSAVAVYSDADTGSLHVREADASVRLPGSASSDTYLRGDLLIDAALRSGADAVHPGYGFLAENAGFARACAAAGLTFIGPTPEAIEAMGSKLESKALVASAGVPVLPSMTVGPDLAGDAAALEAAARRVGLPLLVKASAGGGGKAMRIVDEAASLLPAVEACRREAASSFGDDAVFLERYLSGARHVEIQVFGDGAGTVVHLFERECSIQRRFQKVIEEAPSPAVGPELRRAMGEAAVAAAKAVGYTGAGTVEFLVEDNGRFWFLEMNTRLQVEHPVTELTTGLDMVRLQLLVAAGAPLPAEALTARQTGHAIEARLYAEDPERGFLPTAGRLEAFEFATVEGVRIDAGVASGSEVPVHYDPLLAKVIAAGHTRGEAAARLAACLAGARIHGVTTNRDLLVAVLRHPDFLAGRATTAFLDELRPDSVTGGNVPTRRRAHAAAAALALAAGRRRAAGVLATIPAGFRNNPSQPQRTVLWSGGAEVRVEYRHHRDGVDMAVDGDPLPGLEVHAAAPGEVDITVDGLRRRMAVDSRPGMVFVHSSLGSDDFEVVPRFPDLADTGPQGGLVAPCPGMVVRVLVGAGDKVEVDDPLVVLEAMKMEHTVRAPRAGLVTDVRVSVGGQVAGGDVLAVIEEAL